MAIAFFAALSAGLISSTTAHAESYPAASAQYFYFESAQAICEGGGKVYIADGNQIFRYSESDTPKITEQPLFETRGTIKEMIYSADRLFVLEDDTLDPNPSLQKIGTLNIYTLPDGVRTPVNFSGGNDEGYTHIAVSGNTIFASDMFRWVHKFNATTLTYAGQVLRAGTEINALTAGDGGEIYYAATAASRNHEIYRFASNGSSAERMTQVGSTREEFVTMVYLNHRLTVFTAKESYSYNTQTFMQDGFPFTRPDNLYRVAAGSDGKYYAANNNCSIARFSDFRSAPETLLASCSSEWGFYDIPIDVASRGGRIMVADTINRRISIQNGNTYEAITDLPNLSSVATDTDGYLYFSYFNYGLSKIAKYEYRDDVLTPVADFEFRPNYVSGLRIKLIRADSFGTVYVVAEQNGIQRLYYLTADKVSLMSGFDFSYVDGIGDAAVYGMAAGLNRPEFFVALDDSAASGKIEIVKLTEDGITTTGITHEKSDFIDMAADADGSIYILSQNAGSFELLRYSYNSAAKSHAFDKNYTFPDRTDSNLTRISISAIENSVSKTGYRDILITDSGRHAVACLSVESTFGIPVEKTEIEPKDLISPADAEEEVIRELTQDAPIFARGADAFPMKRNTTAGGKEEFPVVLKKGLRVVVEKLDVESDYSLVIADNTEYAGGVLVGYVRNRYLSEPFQYTDPDEADKMQVVSNDRAFIYRYPLAYLPAELTVTRDKTAPAMEKLKFVTMVEHTIDTPDGEQSQFTYGYTDNYGNEWYRVRYGEQAHEVGYVLAATVDPPGAIPAAQINKNAKIIADPAYPGQAHAPVFYKDESGAMIEDTTLTSALPVGIKVEVVTLPFDSSREYTLIRLSYNSSTYERYVRTVNLAYEGVDILKVVAIIAILTTLAVMGLIIGRYLRIKKDLLPKESAIKYI